MQESLPFTGKIVYNEIIGYLDGMAIIKNENGKLFYCEFPEEFVEKTEIIDTKDLTTIDLLPVEKRNLIIEKFAQS